MLPKTKYQTVIKKVSWRGGVPSYEVRFRISAFFLPSGGVLVVVQNCCLEGSFFLLGAERYMYKIVKKKVVTS